MSFNGSGVFVVNSSGQPVVAATLITSAAFNAFTADAASGLSNAICKDGQTTITANIPFAGFKATGLGAATARTDAASLANVQDGTGIYVGTVGGTADAITLTPSPAIAAYAAGQTFRFIASGANTGAVTVAVSGLAGPKAVTKNGTTALAAGDIASGQMVCITYDGTRFVLASTSTAILNSPTLVTPVLSGSVTGTYTLAGTPTIANPTFTSTTATGNGITMNTGRLLGRTTASAGAIEEMTVGASLTLSGGSLSGTASSTTQAGVIELATQAEVDAATDTSRALYPNHNRIVLTASQATTSGTAFDFTGIPAGTQKIIINFNGVSLSGTDELWVRLGDAGGFETSGYVSNSAVMNAGGTGIVAETAAFILRSSNATSAISGHMILTLHIAASFSWVESHCAQQVNATGIVAGGGTKSLSAELTQVRITRSGTDTFDAGSISISYER